MSTKKPSSEEIFIYANGLMSCSVCAPETMPKTEILRKVNTENSTGISSRWSLSKKPFFKDGASHPCVCGEDATRRHYLFTC